MFDRKTANLQHFMDYAKELGAKIQVSIALDVDGKMVSMITISPPNGKDYPVVFEDMKPTDELSQARILHLKRVLALW